MKKGDIVAITFLDHVMSTNRRQKVIKFEVFGRVVYIDDTSVCIASWIYKDKRFKYDHHNNTIFTLSRPSIESITYLTPRK